MNFLTNNIYGGQEIVRLSINSPLEDDPDIIVHNLVQIPKFGVAPNAPQKNDDTPLKTIDCRVMYGMEVNNVLHFVFGSGANDLANITYGRYNLATDKAYTNVYTEPNEYLAYPSISTFGIDENDPKVLIHFLRSNKEKFAESAVVVCEGQNNDFVYSNSILVKSGFSSVNAIGGDTERWGDYSAAFRRFWNNKTEVWIFGCYGRSTYGSWTSQILAKDENGIRQYFYDFYADNTVVNPGDTVTLTYFGDSIDLSSVQWLVNGSTLINQDSASITLRYDSLGNYDVKLIHSQDTIGIIKSKYISVVPVVIAPITDFYADKTEAFIGDTIQFFDHTLNYPELWKWNFLSGNPLSSNEKNPKVTYAKKGQYTVVLITKNEAGESSKAKQKYITIRERPIVPIADFTSDKVIINSGDSISFSNISLNNPTSFYWKFKGGNIDTATVSNPTVVYNEEGIYPVTLIASNEAGSDTIVKQNYVTVNTTSSVEDNWIMKSNIYPNPVTKSEFTLSFLMNENKYLSFEIINESGTLIKYLLEKTAKKGENVFTFNTEMLSSGNYFLKVYEKGSTFIKTFKFIVLK
jgi:PKD repeat protein